MSAVRSPKSISWFIVLLVILAMAWALFLQYDRGMAPCALCVLQRIMFCSAGVFALIAGCLSVRSVGFRVAHVFVIISVIIGVVFSLRQAWLQHLGPLHAGSCRVFDLGDLVRMFPLHKALALAFSGSGECATVHMRFLGLSLAGWGAVLFVVIGILSVFAIFRSLKSR